MGKPLWKNGLVYAGVTALSWSFLAIGVKVGASYMDTMTLSWCRFTVATISLSLIALVFSPRLFQIFKKPPVGGVIAALFLAANYYGFMHGLRLSSPGNAQIFIQMGPVAVALVGIFYFKEQVSKRQLAGFLLMLLGFVFFYEDQVSQLLGEEKLIFNQGSWWVFFGAMTWAVYTIMQKKNWWNNTLPMS